MKYRVPHFIPIAISLLLMGCLGALMLTTFSKNKESYQELLNHVRNFEQGQEIEAKQGRIGVAKEIWYNQDGKRLQLLLNGDEAHVNYAHTLHGKEIVEHLTNVTAWLQEETEPGVMGRLRSAKAKDAEYHYASKVLKANDVMIEEYSSGLFTSLASDLLSYRNGILLLEGSVALQGSQGLVNADQAEIPLEIGEGRLLGNVDMRFLNGERLTCGYALFEENGKCAKFYDHVTFSQSSGKRLEADYMEIVFGKPVGGRDEMEQEIVSVNAIGNVILSQEDQWSLTADEARFDRKDNAIWFTTRHEDSSPLFFKDHRGRVFARKAVFDLTSQDCILSGDVKMIHREGALEQYALADRVRMIKGEREIRFFSNQGRRVLFYDKINRLQMSAPEISVIKDPSTLQNSVKGKGNVRFHFKDEEYERLRHYFFTEKING